MSKPLCLLLAALIALVPALSRKASAADKLGVAIPYPVDRIDPLMLTEPINRIVLTNIALGLTRIGPDGQIELEAARALQSEQSGSQWVVELNPDIRFPGGRLITAEDVKSSFEFLRELYSARPERSFSAAKAPSIAALRVFESLSRSSYGSAPAGLSFTLAQPDPDFPAALSLWPIVESQIARSFGADFGAGTGAVYFGPYRIRENRPGEGVLLEKSPEFYQPGLPKAEVVDFHYYSDAAEALRSLRIGAVDIIALPTEGQLSDITDDRTLTVLPSPLLNLTRATGPWNLSRAYWSKPGDESDLLRTDRIIVRKSLRTDESFLARFNLSGTYLP